MFIRMSRTMAFIMGLIVTAAPVVANAQRGPGGGGHGGGGGFHRDGGGGRGGPGGGRMNGGPHGGMWRPGDRYDGGGVFVDNWRGYRGLYAPPRGYRWINYGGSFLLAAIATGIITNVIASNAAATAAYPAVATPYPAYGAYPATVAPTPYPAPAYPATTPYPVAPGY